MGALRARRPGPDRAALDLRIDDQRVRNSVTHGSGVDAALVTPRTDETPTEDGEAYGPIKVASENAVRDAAGDRTLIARAGLICGPDDGTDRFGYWPNRFARGGRAVVPGDLAQPAQIIDVRDLADWIVRSGEEHLVGTFDASGPRSTLGAVLDETTDAVGAADLERVPVTPDALTAAGVQPWSGPRSLPLWLTPAEAGMLARDTAPPRRQACAAARWPTPHARRSSTNTPSAPTAPARPGSPRPRSRRSSPRCSDQRGVITAPPAPSGGTLV
ncbi:hypothetical protein ACQPWY_01875 [Pseudonocardia xinjiangensis]|uniref:hypothetical protein n=1 Tax=Pseudonocardia xinjiangensis TaxID=75289 RepID=UPI003D8ABE7D